MMPSCGFYVLKDERVSLDQKPKSQKSGNE